MKVDFKEVLPVHENELFRSVFNSASIGMALVGTDGAWLEVNNPVCRITGYSREELLRKTFQDITYPEDLETDLALRRQLLEGKITHYETEKRYFHKNGRIVWILLTVSLVRDKNKVPRFFISQIQDITEKKRIELEVRRHKTALNAVLNNTKTVITRANRELEVLFINSAVESFIGVKPSEIIGKKFSELASVFINFSKYEKAIAEVFETGSEYRLEVERERGGQKAFYLTHFSPEYDETGEFQTVLGVTFDVTNIKNNKIELRRALAEIKQLQEILPICSRCKNIRDDKDYWDTIENYVSNHTDSRFSHSICPECYETKVKPQLAEFMRHQKNKRMEGLS